ncbi:MAG: hypothetical protein WBN41_17490 [Lysobacterales bacterium]
MIESTVTPLKEFSAPYGKEVKLENVDYENGMRVLRIHIREGNRFTVMDIDENTASSWGAAMTGWAVQSQK